MPDFVDEIEEDAEDFLGFQPKPGGLIDRHRKERARREEAQRLREQIDDAIESPSYTAIKVAPQSPEIVVAQTVTIASGGYGLVLPKSEYRYRAVIMVATSNATVILAKDQGAAISENGFTLPYAIPMPIQTRAQVYAYNNTGATVQVSVWAEVYAPEKG
jgi:hypothetical protein